MKYLIIALLLLSMLPLTSAALTDGLVTYWKFDETTGSTATDSAAPSSDLTLYNMANKDWIPAKLNNGLNFTASDSQQANTTDVFYTSGNFSLSLWVNASDVTPTQRIFDRGSGDGNGLSVWLFSGMLYGSAARNSTSVSAASDTAILPNKYYHVAFLFNDNTKNMELYINGTLQSSYPVIYSVGNQLTTSIGAAAGSPPEKYLGGVVDEVRFYNRTLDTSEILALYNLGGGVSVTLDNPDDLNQTVDRDITFNATINLVNATSITNGTLYVWNENTLVNRTNTTLTGTTNSTGWDLSLLAGSYQWNVLGCNDVGECSFSPSNRTINIGYILNGETHSSTVSELSSQAFKLNLSLASGLSSAQATLLYNGTSNLASVSTIGGYNIYTASVITPDVSGSTSIPFNWILDVTDSTQSTQFNVTSGTQSVGAISIDDCSANSLLILNYTLKDETTQLNINGTEKNSTMEISLILSSVTNMNFNSTYAANLSNNNNLQVCLDSAALNNTDYLLSSTVRYDADGYANEYHNIQNFTLTSAKVPQNINLFDLPDSVSQSFVITFKNNNFLPVANALIEISRNYVGEGVFKSIEIPKTDSSGQTIAHLVLEDVVYNVVVKKNGVVLATFNNVVAICQDTTTGQCTINLNQVSSGGQFTNFENYGGLSYSISFDQSTRTISAPFDVISGATSTVLLNVTLSDALGNTSVCTHQLVTSSGTLSCAVPVSFGNTTITATIYNDGEFVGRAFFNILDSGREAFGETGVIISAMLVIIGALLFIGNPVMMVIGTLLGLVGASLLGFYIGGSLIGVSSILIWVIIAGMILIWRISRRGDG